MGITHDELLAKINRKNHSEGDVLPVAELRQALSAIVELHKPVTTEVGIECAAEEDGEYFHPYPCPTIQFIEKELG